MSIGRPQSFSDIVNAPPDRGSFPLDHYGECKDAMTTYLACLRQHKATSTPCRGEGKAYLECRMAKGLMERDEWRNIGMGDVGAGANVSQAGAGATSSPSADVPIANGSSSLEASKKS